MRGLPLRGARGAAVPRRSLAGGAGGRSRSRLGRSARIAFGQPEPVPPPLPPPARLRVSAPGRRCRRGRFLGARPAGEEGPARRANGAGAAPLLSPTALRDGPQPPGRTSATRARRTLPSRPAVPLLVPRCAEPGPAGLVAARPSRRYPPSLPHSPGPVALPAPVSRCWCLWLAGAAGPLRAPALAAGPRSRRWLPPSPALPRPRPAPPASPGPDVTRLRRALPAAAGPGRAGAGGSAALRGHGRSGGGGSPRPRRGQGAGGRTKVGGGGAAAG